MSLGHPLAFFKKPKSLVRYFLRMNVVNFIEKKSEIDLNSSCEMWGIFSIHTDKPMKYKTYLVILWATKLSWRHICKNLIFLKVFAISFMSCIKRPKGAKESSSSFNEFIITSKSPSRTIETTLLINFKSSYGYHNFYFCNWIWKSNFLGHGGYKHPLFISKDYPNANLTHFFTLFFFFCVWGGGPPGRVVNLFELWVHSRVVRRDTLKF